MTNINCTARVSKYKIYKEDCLGISNSRSLLSSLSNLLARPTIAVVMVDVPKADVAQMKELMKLNHPEAELQGESSSFNNPFAAADGRVHIVH